MQFETVSFFEGNSKKDFEGNYLIPRVPVIIRDFITGSSALAKWNYDYFRSIAGHLKVSVHGSENAHYDKVKSLPVSEMLFADYLDLIESELTELRLFLFNLMRIYPEMRNHIHFNIGIKNFLSSLPFMFFGGKGSSVRNHYDIDGSHVFLTQFKGIKKVLLFSNDKSALLYRLPYNFHAISDTYHPDYEKFPGLTYVKGWSCLLHPGETLFIPAGYWHHIRYESDGYSVAYRALPSSLADKLRGTRNIFLMQRFDNTMRWLLKEKWFEYKVKTAFKRADRAVEKILQQRNAAEVYPSTDIAHPEKVFDI